MASIEELSRPAGERRNPLSQYMRAKRVAARSGTVPNACPYGCTDVELDETGWCKHRVGVVPEKGAKLMECYAPMPQAGKRADGGRWDGEDGDRPKMFVNGALQQPVKETDRLVQVTTSWFVYREQPNPKPDSATGGSQPKK